MSLLDEMAEKIREIEEAFAALNNNEDPDRHDILMAVYLQTYRDLRQLVEKYDEAQPGG